MPDMQTALKEAIKDWDDSAGRHQIQTQTTEENQMHNDYITAEQQQHGDVLRAVFDYIKAHPSCAVNDICASGFQQNTVSSAVNRLYTSGRIVRTAYLEQRNAGHGPVMRNVFRYTAAVENVYDKAATIPNIQPTKRKIKLVKRAAQPAQGIAALPTEIKPSQGILRSEPILAPTPQPTPQPVAIPLTADYIMNNINIAEGKKLYSALYNIFG